MAPSDQAHYRGGTYAQRESLYLKTKAKLSKNGKSEVVGVSGKPGVPKSTSVSGDMAALAKEFGVKIENVEKRIEAKERRDV